MPGGITAQYGFLYQKNVFILTTLQSIAPNTFTTFEGKDDIDVTKNDYIRGIGYNKEKYVQVKSGNVSKTCFSKIIGNWLLLPDEISEMVLYLENDLKFNYKSEDILSFVVEYLRKGKGKIASSIANKVYKKYEDIIDEAQFVDKVKAMIDKMHIVVKSFQKVKEEIVNQYVEIYCKDILIYELAKKKRVERFESYIGEKIDNAISKKNSYNLLYSSFIQIVLQVNSEISDKKYTVDVKQFKKNEKERAINLVRGRNSREVKQLYICKDDDRFVIERTIYELMYLDFREVYCIDKSIEISNIEQSAKANYDESLLTVGNETPLKLFTTTISKEIEGDIFPGGPIYNCGCYVYLTGDGIDEEDQISWGKNDD